MRVSIVTISFNQAPFLERAIRSVTGQRGVDLEYIVVDPGSTDGSREAIGRHRAAIHQAILEKDDGPADGLNRGFAVATGDVFGFLNADDELLPGALAEVVRTFEARPELDGVSGCGWAVDAAGHRLRRLVPSRLTPWLYAHGAVSLFQPGTFFRAAAFRRAGGFNASNRTCWDGELFLDLALTGARFATIGADLALFRLHAGSISGSGRLEEAYRRDLARLFEKATGRARAPRDRWYDLAGRAAKLVLDPAYLLRRLAPAGRTTPPSVGPERGGA